MPVNKPFLVKNGVVAVEGWQRNYYERKIREEDEFRKAWQYIISARTRCYFDPDNPHVLPAKTPYGRGMPCRLNVTAMTSSDGATYVP